MELQETYITSEQIDIVAKYYLHLLSNLEHNVNGKQVIYSEEILIQTSILLEFQTLFLQQTNFNDKTFLQSFRHVISKSIESIETFKLSKISKMTIEGETLLTSLKELSLLDETASLSNSTSVITRLRSLIIPVHESKILEKASDFALLKEWVSDAIKDPKFELIYQGSRNGFSAQNFHDSCDEKGPTLVLIKPKEGKVIGGFAYDSWKRIKTPPNIGQLFSGHTSSSDKVFVFCLHDKKKYSIKPNRDDKLYSTVSHPHLGPIFGCYSDLYIHDNCNANSYSYMTSHLTNIDSIPKFNKRTQFTVSEIEVYAISQTIL